MDVERAALDAFRRVCDLGPPDREAALAELAPPVRERVAAMLAADEAASALDTPGLGRLARAMGEDLARRDLDAEAVAALPAVGDRVGAYRIVRVIGAGGMGIVYEAEQEHPRRRVALKTVHPFLRNPATLARFDAEVRLLGGLLHPAIPQAYQAFVAGDAPWLAMELVLGDTVDRATVGWSERACVGLLAELGEAVDHAARRGVIHGDIQPGNVLVTAEGRPKLLDFGLARSLEDDGGELRGGTRGFVSPGQAPDRAGPLDTRSDVFALGQLGRALIPRPHRDVAAILANATRARREDRYATASGFAEDCRRFLAHEPVRAREATALYRLERFARRNRALLMTGGASLALGSAVWGGAAWSQRAARQALLDQTAQRIGLELDALAGRSAAEVVGPLADAYTRAPTPEVQHRALLALTEALLAVHEGEPGAAVARLRALGPVPPAIEAESARRQRRFDDRQPGWLAAWGRSVPLHPVGLAWGFGEVAIDPQTGEGWVVTADDEVRRIGPAGLGASAGRSPGTGRWTGWIVSGDPLRMVTVGLDQVTRIWEHRGGALVELASRRDTNTQSAAGQAGGVWLGLGPPDRGLLRWDPAGWSRPAPAVDAVDSDVSDVVPWGEGLLLAQGPWSAYAVRALGPDHRVRWDVQPGTVVAVAPYRRADGGWGVFAPEVDREGSAEIFGPDDPEAGPPGLNVLAVRGDRATLRAELPWPDALQPLALARPVVADLDGDGREDVAFGLYDRAHMVTAVALQEADGDFQPWIFVRGLWIRAAAQLDGDPPWEVLGHGPGMGARWLGIGEEGVPPLPDVPPSVSPPPGADDAVLRALTVADLGLFSQAGAAVARVAEARGGDPALYGLAAELYERSAPARVADISHLDRAQELLDRALLGRPGDPALLRAARRVAIARFDGVRAEDLSEALGERLPFAGRGAVVPPSAWSVRAPESVVRRDGDSVKLLVWNDQTTLLELPVRYAGGPVRLDVGVEVLRAETGAGIEVQLVPEGTDEPALRVGVYAAGGATTSVLRYGCEPWVGRVATPRLGPSERATVSLTQGVIGDRRVCGMTDHTGSRQTEEPWREPPPGLWRLRVVAQPTPWPPRQYADLDLREVRVAGVTLLPAPAGTEAGGPDGALVEALRAGDRAGVADTLPRASDALVDRLLRTEYRTLTPLLDRFGAEALSTRLGRVWGMAARDGDDPVTAAFLDDPTLLDLPARSPEAASLLLAVARRADRLGLPERAHRLYTRIVDEGPPEVARHALLGIAERRRVAGDRAGARALLVRWEAGSAAPNLDHLWLRRLHPELASVLEEGR